MKNLKELKAKFEELGKEIEKIEQEETMFIVPDNIKLYTYGDGTQGIINGKQALYYSVIYKTFGVGHSEGFENKKHKLIKTTKEELKPGDVVYMNNNKLYCIGDLSYYSLILNNGDYYSWVGKDLINDNCNWKYYYKVVLIKE